MANTILVGRRTRKQKKALHRNFFKKEEEEEFLHPVLCT
jgi:hypothetical protein